MIGKIKIKQVYEVNNKYFDNIQEAKKYIKLQHMLHKLYKEQNISEQILLNIIKEDMYDNRTEFEKIQFK